MWVGWCTERKKMPGTAGGTVRLSTPIVSSATFSVGALGPSRPFLTMLGLSTCSRVGVRVGVRVRVRVRVGLRGRVRAVQGQVKGSVRCVDVGFGRLVVGLGVRGTV